MTVTVFIGKVVMVILGMQKLYMIFGRHGTFLYTNGLCGKYTSAAVFSIAVM